MNKKQDDLQKDYNYVGLEEPKYKWELVDVMEQLSIPTNPDFVKKLPNKNLYYVSGDYVIQQLNRLFLMQWSFSVINQIYQSSANDKHGNTQNPTVQVLGRLEVPGLGYREQWGSSVVKGGADVQESDYKSATTDALKKCASMFGIAMDLYSGPEGFMPVTPDRLLTERQKEIKYLKTKGTFYSIEEQKKLEEHQKQKQQLNSTKEVSNESAKEVKKDTISDKIESDISEEITTHENLSDSFIPTELSEMETTNVEEIKEDTSNISERNIEEKTEEITPDYVDPTKIMSTDSIQELKELKNQLGIKTNDELSQLLVEFFEDETATAHWINPKNISDVNVFLRKKLNNS